MNRLLTLNECKVVIKNWFQNHAMINSVYYESDWDFNAERSIDYPVANVEYVNSSMSDKTINHNFKIVIGDLTKPDDSEMEDNIHSDSLQVAEDFFTYLQNYEGFYFTKISTLTPFTDDLGDRAAGIVFTITIQLIRPQNRCNQPTR